jgi:two-component system OmpR family response regulator
VGPVAAGERGRHAAAGLLSPGTVGAIRVLLVEDDARLADVTVRSLEAEGLVVDRAARGAQALSAFAETRYDVAILDVGLPDMDGFEVCRRMRAQEVWCPVLMLTARTQLHDRVEGLDAGADDYLGKPFEVAELLARVRALARRGPVRAAPVLQVGGLRMDPATHEVWRDGRPVALSMREFALLEALMRHPGQVLSRDALLDQAWPAGTDQRSNVVEACVRNLREKVDRPFGIKSVENVRGAGYRLRRDGGR